MSERVKLAFGRWLLGVMERAGLSVGLKEPCCPWEGSNRCCENYPPTCDCEEERFEAFRAGWQALAAARRPDSAEMHAAFARHMAYGSDHLTDSAVENGSTP